MQDGRSLWKQREILPLSLALFSVLPLGCERGGSGSPPEPGAGEEVIPVIAKLPEFTLTDKTGGSFGSADLHGEVWIADFIFTRCGGTCPMQTAEKVKLQEELQQKL